eukprot:4913_1
MTKRTHDKKKKRITKKKIIKRKRGTKNTMNPKQTIASTSPPRTPSPTHTPTNEPNNASLPQLIIDNPLNIPPQHTQQPSDNARGLTIDIAIEDDETTSESHPKTNRNGKYYCKRIMLCMFILYLLCFVLMWILIPVAINTFVFLPPDYYTEIPSCFEIPEPFFIESSSGNRIAAIHLKQANATNTIIYSHGNAENILMPECATHVRYLAIQLNVNVIFYDYSGYGLSDGVPSEMALYHDIESVYNYSIQTLGIDSSRIILWGLSLGSGPTCYLASKYSNAIGGVILQSAFKSIATVLIPESMMRVLKQITFKHNNVDMFRNMDYIENIVDCPVLVMHGTNDRLISISDAKYLYRRLKEKSTKNVTNYWANNCGHIDVIQNNLFYPEDELTIKLTALINTL